MVMGYGFEDLDLDRLRRRRSEKWRLFPPDVLPAFIAEMDYDLAEPVLAALPGSRPRSPPAPVPTCSATRTTRPGGYSAPVTSAGSRPWPTSTASS